MCDITETIHGSLIQHGKHNDRVYIMHLDPDRENDLLPALEKLVRERGYRKILAKIPATSLEAFQSAKFILEARIPLLFSGSKDGYFVGRFFSDNRHVDDDLTALEKIVKGAPSQHVDDFGMRGQLPIKRCSREDAEELASFYRKSFVSYPFPIFHPAYLVESMNKDVGYYCIRHGKQIIAAAAADTSPIDRYSEMTDFATVPDRRNQGLAASLLDIMERDVESAGILTAFTIARAASHGMNMVFRKLGYHYAGLLESNTQISGRIESMTVWYKSLRGGGG